MLNDVKLEVNPFESCHQPGEQKGNKLQSGIHVNFKLFEKLYNT